MKKILLVDDQVHILRVIKLSLDRNGYEVDTALNADVALRMMREVDYDVVIADDHLEVLSGRLLLESVIKQFPHRLPFLLLVSGAHDKQLSQWLSEHRGVELVDKPMSLRWLVARLNEVFGYYEQRSAV